MSFILRKPEFHLKRISKSGILILLLVSFSFIVLAGFTYISFLVKRYYKGDTLIVNKMGQVRGSIQRYSKLKLFCEDFKEPELCSRLKEVELFVNSTLEFIKDFYLKNPEFSDIKKEVKVMDTFYELEKKWKILQNLKDKKELVKKSENVWHIADVLTDKAQKISEIKEKRISFIIDSIRNVILLFVIFLILTVYFLITKNLEKDVVIDKLTLLYNRHSFQNEVKRRIWISRKDGVPVSILIIDIDFFKKVNDTFGHIKGDEVLSKVAHIIKSQIRGKDLAFRFGGEEFIVVLPGVGKDEALNVAERIRKAVENTDFGIGKKITVSCGIAEYSPGETLEQFIERADKALYKAKNGGRNRCELAENG